MFDPANEEDFQKCWIRVAGTDENLKALPIDAYKANGRKGRQTIPSHQSRRATLREVVSGLINNWSAIITMMASSINRASPKTWKWKTASAAVMGSAAALCMD